MKVGLLIRCLGCNSTMVAMSKHPEEFTGVRGHGGTSTSVGAAFYRACDGECRH